MIVIPKHENHIEIMAETDIESFFMQRFLEAWGKGQGTIFVKSGIMGESPQHVLRIEAPRMNLIPSPFIPNNL